MQMRRFILVVDDDLIERKVMHLIFKEECEVMTVPTADEAIRVLSRRVPDLLISDLQMPGRGGISLLQQVRGMLPELPVLVVSGYVEGEELGWLINQGIPYLVKPYHPASLHERVHDMMSQEAVH